jgi:outer membrane protein OmpA-like peptidoglycan-associated protein
VRRRYGIFGRSIAFCAITIAVPAAAQRHVSFVACPVAQDTGPRSDVCFFVRHDGVRYGLASPPDWGNPQLGHKLLVEGTVNEGAQECGGTQIAGRASVMPELSRDCNEIAPATPEILALKLGRRPDITDDQRAMIAADPSSSLQIMRLRALPVPEVVLARTETIHFPFDSDRASGPDALMLVELARLAKETPAASISVNAFRGASLLDDGEILREREDMARLRGEKIADILVGLGAPEGSIALEVDDRVSQPDGKADWQARRVEIRVSSSRLGG